MSNLSWMIEQWQGVLERPGEMTGAVRDRLVDNWGKTPTRSQGDNRPQLARGIVDRGGQTWPGEDWDWLGDIEDHRNGFDRPNGNEDGSPEYSGWREGALGMLLPADRWWAASKPWLIAHALSCVPQPKKIYLQTHLNTGPGKDGLSRRTLNDGEPENKWLWGPGCLYSLYADARSLWADPLDLHTLLQRAPAHPLVSLACGRSVKITNWTHSSFGLPLWSILDKKASRPLAWGQNLSYGAEAVRHLGELPPLSGGIVIRWFYYENGAVAVMVNKSLCGTRGNLSLAIFTASSAHYYTAAQDKGEGQHSKWWQSTCEHIGTDFRIESEVGRFWIPAPGKLDMSVTWDAAGARRGGEPVEPPEPTKAHPLIYDGLALIDRGLTAQPVTGIRDVEARRVMQQMLDLAENKPLDKVATSLESIARRLRAG